MNKQPPYFVKLCLGLMMIPFIIGVIPFMIVAMILMAVGFLVAAVTDTLTVTYKDNKEDIEW